MKRSFFLRVLLTVLTYVGSLVVLVPSAFFAVLFLAGPHGGFLPSCLAPGILILGWLVVLVAPIWLSCRVWRRLGHPPPSAEPRGL